MCGSLNPNKSDHDKTWQNRIFQVWMSEKSPKNVIGCNIDNYMTIYTTMNKFIDNEW